MPFFVDVVVGEPLYGMGDHRAFIDILEDRITALDAEVDQPDWT